MYVKSVLHDPRKQRKGDEVLPFVQKVEKLHQQVIGCDLHNPRQQRLTEEAVVGGRLGRCSQEENFNSDSSGSELLLL